MRPEALNLDSTPGTTGNNYTLTYDDVGNLTNDGRDYKYEYDAFGRLRKIKNQSSAVVEEFLYNGLNHRIAWAGGTEVPGRRATQVGSATCVPSANIAPRS